MRLGGLIDGLHQGQYQAFATGLLALASDLPHGDLDAQLPVAEWLTEYLPALSAVYARTFSEVDSRLNSAVAAAYDVARNLPDSGADPAFGDEIADAVAQLALLMPDIEYYFGLPVRDTVTGNVGACNGLAARKDEAGNPTMTRDLFDDCIESLVSLAENQTRSAALSGSAQGPFGDAQLQREVSVTPVQRINYVLGYLHQRDDLSCAITGGPLPSACGEGVGRWGREAPAWGLVPRGGRGIGRRLRGRDALGA